MLADIQKQLEDHFTALARERAPLQYPLYALEHGLDAATLETIRHQLTQTGRLDSRYWLLWVVVATEIGYAYDGEEYWRSFEECISDWRVFGDRHRIRDWFTQFADRFGGFRPRGRWAEHFSIIAWPITHAILPRDLQGQFARHLYNLRYSLANDRNISLEKLGALLQGGDARETSRFQHFLEQPELTARLVLALRDEPIEGQVTAISPSTLARIVVDLERRQSARDWLRDVRRVLRDAQLRTSASLVGRGNTTGDVGGVETLVNDTSRLVGRQDADGVWHIGVAFPDFTALLHRASVPAAALDGARVRLRLGQERWMPARALLGLSTGEQPVVAIHALLAGNSVMTVEPDRRGLNALLASALRIRGTSPWLLRKHEDGVARQVLGNHVRSQQKYLLLTEAALPESAFRGLDLQQVAITTPEAFLYRLAIGRTLSAGGLASLKALNLGYALRATIEPIGLVPRWGGASDYSVWLTTEEPVLRLSADHPVDEFTVTLDRGRSLRIPLGGSAEAMVSLGHLSVGLHLVEVGGSSASPRLGRVEPEQFELMIRPPEPWLEAIQGKTGFRPVVEPADAGLELVLDGRAPITILGPAERAMRVAARLYNTSGHTTEEVALGDLASLGDRRALLRTVQRLTANPLAEKVQAAPRVDLVFNVEDLGTASLSFANKVRPIRWKLEHCDGEAQLRLIDEAGSCPEIKIDIYPLETPTTKRPADAAAFLFGSAVAAPGALYSAVATGERYSAIVCASPRTRLTSLSHLGTPINIAAAHNEPRYIPSLLSILRLWSRARQTLGPLSPIRRSEVCTAIDERIGAILCGMEWMHLASQCRSLQDRCLERLRRDIGGSPGFTSRLMSTDWGAALGSDSLRTEFTRLANLYQISDDRMLCGLAFRVAFEPTTIKFTVADRGAADWARLSHVPALVRGAYLARLAMSLRAAGQPNAEVA